MEIPKFLLKFTGDAYLHTKPMWFVYKPQHHKVKGFEIRQLLNCMQPGDILLRRMDGYVNTLFTPGFWGHAGLYIGDNTLIHAIGVGVIKEDILDFCRTDSVSALRVKNVTEQQTQSAVNIALKLEAERTGYDYQFKADNGTVYCTELVDICYDKIFRSAYSNTMGHCLLIPDHLFESPLLQEVLTIKH